MLKEKLIRMANQTPPVRHRHGLRGSLDISEGDSELVRMFKEHKADKWFCHSYIPVYEYLFEDIRDKPLDILEIGIWRGDSIRIWEKYFPHANITGLDIDPNCAKFNFERAKVEIQDQTNYRYFFENYKDRKFDIVIEDGKHEYLAQLSSASILHNFMKDDSIYVIEDINCDSKWFSILNGVWIDLRYFKKRFDDQMILLPHGEIFTAKAKYIKEIVENMK